MKDILKMQGVTRPVVGIKKLIDYYNENYTKKKEYICKDLKPIKLLDADEYNDFREKAGIHLSEVTHFPLFKLPKIIEVDTLNYIFKLNKTEFKGTIHTHDKGIFYKDDYIGIITNKNKCVLNLYQQPISTKNVNCSLTLYIDSPELPKLEYPKNKMDMYRAYNFIEVVCYSIDDENLYYLLYKIMLDISLPDNIDEIDLFLESSQFCHILDIRNNAYFVNRNKDNYYTILDAIKKGKTIYKNLDTPLVNWKINKEEKAIYLGDVIATETGLETDPE
ncbi:hypothetical protein [uncultured Clostridium sp.]|uniref:hypothetical protein n=1 Tax=uncultured Clostridium sp. TaxID=59620 RepID=UPI0025940659|nr:hypothetical protein [uncultured Clostridium sp.]